MLRIVTVRSEPFLSVLLQQRERQKNVNESISFCCKWRLLISVVDPDPDPH
jgi:hypothetical protein